MKIFKALFKHSICAFALIVFFSCQKSSRTRSVIEQDTGIVALDLKLKKIDDLSDSIIRIQDTASLKEWSYISAPVNTKLSYELGYVQSTLDLGLFEVSAADQQQLFLSELKLLQIKGQPSPPTGVDMVDTTVNRYSRCLTADPSSTSAQKNFGIVGMRLRPANLKRLSFKVNCHIVYPVNRSADEQSIPNRLRDQFALMNSVFNPYNITFVLNTVTETTNNAWASNVYRIGKEYKEMTRQLSRNPDREINLYLVNLNNVFLGFSTFPWDEAVVQNRYLDAIVISPAALSGSTDATLSGKTLIHEMGHFFGLFHTFRDISKDNDSYHCCKDKDYNGCSGPGDEVPDTPPQRFCHFMDCQKCDLQAPCTSRELGVSPCDTCPSDNLNDMLNNYMGYSPDDCMNAFTNNQIERMWMMILAMRQSLVQEQSIFNLIQ